MTANLSDYIPGQYIGGETETSDHVVCEDEGAAIALFNLAKQRLLNINGWHEYWGFLSPGFVLTDYAGEPIEAEPAVGHFIRIEIPGPGMSRGRGYDWARVEKIKQIELDHQQELFFLQLRPAPYPLSGETEVAHFFRDSATTSFLLVREICQVTAAIYGRNEVPNNQVEDAVDKIRNQVVGNSGATGLSQMQWKSLVAAILKS